MAKKSSRSILSKLSFRSNVITGVLVLAPIGAVLGIVIWFWNMMVSVADLAPEQLKPKSVLGLEHPALIHGLDFAFTLFVLALVVALLFFVGLISRNYLGQKILDSISGFFARVPVLSTVYSTLEQLVKTFGSGQAKNFRRVVLVEYPRKGVYTLAFVTGERDADPMTGRRGIFLNIYVPTTPNPTSGFYLCVASEEVKNADITVEQALKEIISMGIVHKDG